MAWGFPKQTSSRNGTTQDLAFNAAGQAAVNSTAFGSQTYQIRVGVTITGPTHGTSGARITIGGGTGAVAPAATATSTFLPFLQAFEYYTVTPGQQISVLSNDASTGHLTVTEVS